MNIQEKIEFSTKEMCDSEAIRRVQMGAFSRLIGNATASKFTVEVSSFCQSMPEYAHLKLAVCNLTVSYF